MRRLLRGLAALCLLGTVFVLPSPAHAAAGQYTFNTGAMAAGSSRTWHWNNAGTGNAYQVGLSPQGATAAATCEFEVVRDWYAQLPGEIEYWFTVKNVGTISCNADVTLAWNTTSGSTPTLSAAPGETAGTWYHYDPSPATTAISVALIPSGGTAADPCQYEIERMQVVVSGGERRHGITVVNVGAITCSVTVRVTPLASSSSWSSGSMTPMSTKNWRWNNANPLTAVHVVTLNPNQDARYFSIERTWYLQRINTDGSAEREFWLTVKHFNSPANATAQVLLARAA
ncbi:hypothetical protein Cme02nite_02820 [Catellatospora methionotrophica]|uniref:Uncharacterized protein n=1 Tax=Catellatospora methionotrophica TaxID=121620 RepID=A0A8J3LC62_9ACTN|nr:hypothetical protein [Catellatospora methionotrophica]GIG11950.1 hypothetical protein Cme02nite_02820 [Catellatospora methionotrophica]